MTRSPNLSNRSVILVAVLGLSGCQSAGSPYRHTYHESDPGKCAEVAQGALLHAVLKKMREDGTCDVAWMDN